MKLPHSCNGFSLVEVALALGIMTFCLVPLMALMPVGLSSNQTAIEQTAAGNIATSIANDLLSTPCTSGTSNRFGFNMAASGGTPQTLFFGEDASPTGAIGSDASTVAGISSRYRVSVNLYPSRQRRSTMVRVLVTWPAFADRSGNGLPINFSGSFDTVIALNRN